jgi:hypothetical protein
MKTALQTEEDLRAQLDAANRRIEQLDDILERKNMVIRLLALGDMGAGKAITAAMISEEHSLGQA